MVDQSKGIESARFGTKWDHYDGPFHARAIQGSGQGGSGLHCCPTSPSSQPGFLLLLSQVLTAFRPVCIELLLMVRFREPPTCNTLTPDLLEHMWANIPTTNSAYGLLNPCNPGGRAASFQVEPPFSDHKPLRSHHVSQAPALWAPQVQGIDLTCLSSVLQMLPVGEGLEVGAPCPHSEG